MGVRKLILCALVSFFIISCEDIISVQDISEDQVIALSPVNGAEVVEGDVSFSWSSIDLADTYEFQISTPDFTSAQEIISNTIVSDSITTTISTEMNLTAGDYEWRVRATNTAYQTDYTTNSLTVLEEEIPVSDLIVELTAPEDDLVTTATSIMFNWEPIEGIEGYRLLIEDTSNESVVFESLEQSTSQTVDLAVGTYLWKVRGENDTASTLFSERTLTIE